MNILKRSWNKSIFSIPLLLLCLAYPAYAAPIKWTLENVSFTDGGTATGSFVYDTATGTFQDIQILISGGTNGVNGNFNFLCVDQSSCGYYPSSEILPIFTTAATDTPVNNREIFSMSLQNALSSTGGTISLQANAIGKFACASINCAGVSPNNRSNVLSGSITGSPVITAVETTAVPSLSFWSLIFLTFTLGIFTTWRQRRRPTNFVG